LITPSPKSGIGFEWLKGNTQLERGVARFVLNPVITRNGFTVINLTAFQLMRHAIWKCGTSETHAFNELGVFTNHALCFSHHSPSFKRRRDFKRLEGNTKLDCPITRFVLHAMIPGNWAAMIKPTARDFMRNTFRERRAKRTLTFDEGQVLAQHALGFSHFSIL
jgi:hypothetical protein